MPIELVFMIVTISVVGIGAGVYSEYIKGQQKLAEKKADSGISDEVLKRLDDITRRLEALEVIVTDEDHELTRKFEKLKQRANRGAA